MDGYLCAGFSTGPNVWLGLYPKTELERSFKPGSWLRRIERADDAKEMCRFYPGVLDPDSSERGHKIISIAPLGNEE